MGLSIEEIHCLDLVAYFRRIGYAGPADPSLEVMEAPCLRHAGAIPFENLDPLAGIPGRLERHALQAKLVAECLD